MPVMLTIFIACTIRLAINLRTRPPIKAMTPITKVITPITKAMTAINKDKSGSESGSIPIVHPCNSSMPPRNDTLNRDHKSQFIAAFQSHSCNVLIHKQK